MNEAIKEKLVTEKTHDFTSLTQLVEVLCAPGGCPWDIEQTHQSIRSSLIEETYEVVEAIDTDDAKLLREELGDLLFQIVFHSDIARREGSFTISDVISDVCAKMIFRHPHVFGSGDADTSEKVLDAWEKLKKEEKSRLTLRDELEAIPRMLPALMRCQKVAGKAMKNGYDLKGDEGKTDDELVETLLAAAVELKKRNINAEEAVTKKIDAFIASVER